MGKKIRIVFLIILILFGIAGRFLAINKDFTAEETDFVKTAEALKNTGRPIYYLSEQQPSELALWHPPMYVFLMSLMFKVLSGEAAARIINILFSIFTSLLIFLFCSKIISNEKGKIIGLISSAFFLINYFFLSSSIQIDIDILSTFFVFSFIFSMLMYYKSSKKYFLFLATISLLFSLFNRYPIAILVYVCLGVYYYTNKELKRDFKKYVYTGIFSAMIFITIWGFYSIFIEPGTLFYFLLHNITLGGAQFSSLGIYFGSFFLNIIQLIRLFTLPSIILLIWAFLLLSKRNSKLIRILVIYSLSILLFFLFIPRPAFGYPRYFMSMAPGVSILIGIFLYTNFENQNSGYNRRYILFGILSFIASLILLLLLNPQSTIYASDGLIKATNFPDFISNILASLPLLFILFYKEKRKIAVVILVSLIFSYSLFFDIKLINHHAHIKETGEYLREKTSESEIIISPKAVGYYTDRKFYINDENKPPLNFSLTFIKEYVKKSLENKKMDDEFFWPKGVYSGIYNYPSPPEQEKLGGASYVVLYHPVDGKSVEKKIGDFYIYNLKIL